MRDEYDFEQAEQGGPIRKASGKTRITIMFDNDLLEEFRRRGDASGAGYQTLINRALREYLARDEGALEETLRRVIREELHQSA